MCDDQAEAERVCERWNKAVFIIDAFHINRFAGQCIWPSAKELMK